MIFSISKNSFYAIFLLFCLGFTWGTSFSIAKFAMESGITPLGYSFWQSLGPAVLVFIFAIIKNKKIPPTNIKHIIFYFICGLLGIALPNLTMYFSATHVPSGILGLIVNTSPIITYVFSLIFLIEKYSWQRLSGILIGFIGLFILFLPKLSSYSEYKWMLFSLFTPILLASCTIFMVKFRPTKTSSIELSSGMLFASTILILPLVISSKAFHPIAFPLNTPDLFILIEIFLSSIGYILFFELLRIAGPVFYSLVGCIVALAGLFWGYVIFNENIKPIEWLSVFLILLAIILVTKKESK
ncbi:DMT family transporter [Pigmentibacter sp. JX0631]|uniref:DMT family transporter n=1 Tax=Pigmentibacter sp. JX0631 TaxID=2976982 RepID=UPI00246844D9|nr:DMT family transporter [Pigmentibacter sp. JX0631]WGL61207.1 DMT family transporter [Pigmentibacter sp. JX0631]